MNKIYKCKKCNKFLNSKEIVPDLEFDKSVKVFDKGKDILSIPVSGCHKNCGGEVIVVTRNK